jgi:hypothetical protein
MSFGAAPVRALACAACLLHPPAPAQGPAPAGPAIVRTANMPDGAPAFDVRDADGRRVRRIECIWNGWYVSDDLAARLMGATVVMAAVIRQGGLIVTADLGPAIFDCVVVTPAAWGGPT